MVARIEGRVITRGEYIAWHRPQLGVIGTSLRPKDPLRKSGLLREIFKYPLKVGSPKKDELRSRTESTGCQLVV